MSESRTVCPEASWSICHVFGFRNGGSEPTEGIDEVHAGIGSGCKLGGLLYVNVVAMKTTVVNGVGVGQFTQAPIPNESPNQIMCRAVGPIKTPDGESFAEFVKAGFISELKIADVYAPAAPVQLTGQLENIGFSSMSGTWNLGLTVKSSNGRSMSVAEAYSYTSSVAATTPGRPTCCARPVSTWTPG